MAERIGAGAAAGCKAMCSGHRFNTNGLSLNDEFGSTVQDVTDRFGGFFIEIPTLVVQNNHMDQLRYGAGHIWIVRLHEQYTPDIV